MKLAALAAGLALVAAPAVSAPGGQSADAERLALARALAAELGPFMAQATVEQALVQVTMAWSDIRLRETMPDLPRFAPRIPITELDVPQFYASLKIAVAKLGPRLTDADAARYARDLDTPTLKAAVDFFSRPAERDLQKRRLQFGEAMSAQQIEEARALIRGRISREQAEQEMLKLSRQAEGLAGIGQSDEEAMFDASPAGRAFHGDDKGLEGVAPALEPYKAMWPDLVATAAADYCGRRPCEAKTHAFFDALAAAYPGQRLLDMAAPSPADPSLHRMDGMLASDVFAVPADAALARAACAGDADAVQAEVKAGANPNAGGEGGASVSATPLTWAMDCDSLAGIKALLESGANPNLTAGNAFDRHPVTIAAAKADAALLKLLLQHGADPSVFDSGGPPLEHELRTGHSEEGWQALLDAGADCNGVGQDPPALPLPPIAETAADLGAWDKVAQLMERGCKVSTDVPWMAQHAAAAPSRLTPAAAAALPKVIALLQTRGVKFPVGAPTMPETYRALDGSMKTSDALAWVNLTRDTQYAYLPNEKTFVRNWRDGHDFSHGAEEVTEAQLRAAGFSANAIAAVKRDPQGFTPLPERLDGGPPH